MSVWPPITYAMLGILDLGFVIAKHGQPRDPYSVWSQVFAIALSWSILWWGGFFEPLLPR